MSHEVLKELLIAVGFKTDESSYKRATTLIANVEKQLVANEKAAKEREASEKSRVANQTLRAAEVASNLRMVGAAVAGFATLAAGALSAVTTAVKNGIGEFDRLAYVSGRTGASVNNIKAIGYAFSQTGSSAEAAVQALESFAKARRANLGVDAMIRSYGVSTQGDSSEVLANSLDAITKRYPQYTSQQIAGLFGISPDEVDHWIRYRKEIAQFEQQYKDLQRTFGVNGGEMARASTAISRAMGEWSGVIEVLRDKMVSLFLPAVEAVAKGLSELLSYVTSEENVAAFAAYFDKPIAAVKELARLLKVLYDQFVVLFEYVRNSPLGKIIGAVNPGFIRDRLLDAVVPSAQAATNPEGDTTAGGGKPGIVQRGWNAVKRAFGGGATEDTSGGRLRQSGGLAAGAKESYDFWIGKGFTPAQAAGLVGMEEGESKFNPRAVGDGGLAHGAFQHHPDRRRAILRGTGINVDTAKHAQQLEAAWWELNNTERGALAKIKAATSPGEAAAAGVWHFERPDDKAGEARLRGQYANRWHRQFGTATPEKPVAVLPRAQGAPAVMSPGTFNVDDALRSQPMGSVSNSNDNSRSATMNSNVNVTVNGASDPQATASAVTRGVGQAHDMSLRNVQTAIR